MYDDYLFYFILFTYVHLLVSRDRQKFIILIEEDLSYIFKRGISFNVIRPQLKDSYRLSHMSMQH